MLFMVYPQMIPGKGQPVGGGSSVGEVNRTLGGLVAGVISGTGSSGGREPSSVGSVSTASVAVKAERFQSRIFGFRANEEAKLDRWRTAKRDA